ncbi:MAG: FtsX-like permease family protein [Nanoarchaeota archaeon]
MITKELLKYSLHALWQRKLRSFLTILSIFIGIMTIFALMSFGQGLSSYIGDIAASMGTDKLIIQPKGFSFGPPPLDSNVNLDDGDVDFVAGVNGVSEATGVYILSGEVQVKNQKKFAYVFGSDFADHDSLVREVYALSLFSGNELDGDESAKAMLGHNYLLNDKIFSKSLRVGDRFLLNNITFTAIGFYEAVGNPVDDANIYITHEAAEKLFGADNYQFILVRSQPGKDPSSLATTLNEKLRQHRDQAAGQEDFHVQTFEQLLQTFTSILFIIRAVLIMIALISVFVAFVNIMNTMYTSVLERTKEIGVMKAIGARNKDILFIFVLESGLLGLLGGILGVLAGYGVASVAGAAIVQAGYGILQPQFTLVLVVGCLLFSFFVGMFAGFLPAKRASLLRPVESLQYE